MAKIKGVCHNYEGCDMASEKVVQEVEKSNFVCQECGKPLYPVKQPPQPWWKKHQRELTLGVGVLIIGGGITGGILAFGGDKEEPVKEPAEVKTEQVDSTKVDSVVAQPQAEEPKAEKPKAEITSTFTPLLKFFMPSFPTSSLVIFPAMESTPSTSVAARPAMIATTSSAICTSPDRKSVV